MIKENRVTKSSAIIEDIIMIHGPFPRLNPIMGYRFSFALDGLVHLKKHV
uniref:Uncharacterized protein n=1 Tax=Rhizophora mucronata TaxID=61149 RepID=A0A2P2KK14_RHIMU